MFRVFISRSNGIWIIHSNIDFSSFHYTHIWIFEEYQKHEAVFFSIEISSVYDEVVSKKFFFQKCLLDGCFSFILFFLNFPRQSVAPPFREANNHLLAIWTIPSVILHFTIHFISNYLMFWICRAFFLIMKLRLQIILLLTILGFFFTNLCASFESHQKTTKS